ncbi:MAG: 3-dehydroquinate synthase [Alphaproteobacteria bacterium]|nr:3-dehydroquinate synthase [Alphaproteobacteria bacterium]
MSGTEKRVRVDLGARGYDILIGPGLLPRAGDLIRPLADRDRVFIVYDEVLARIEFGHLKTLRASLEGAGFSVVEVSVPSGETSKSMQQLDRILGDLISQGAERDDLVLAFGGGVIGDLTGLASGLLKRGARFVQIPTTLLAQVDSSVGGKTAVNSPAGKNMIGLFHQPVLVLADLDVLETLPARERAAGLAEVAKYALIDNPEFFDFLERNADRLRNGDKAALAEAVRASCEAKARIVALDETEQAERALLNLGHTFGHALERANGYGPELLHGEAVAAGMAMAMRYSVKLGLCSGQDATRAEHLLNALGLTTRLDVLGGGPYAADDLFGHMAHDKKAKAGRMTLILSRGIGRAFIQKGADAASVRDFLHSEADSAS